jgi:Tfp pilus assembly protein PilF
MQVRDFSKASTYLEKAAELAPKAAGVRTSLGLSRLAQGDQARGLSELEMATSLDPKSTQATMALVQTEMRPEALRQGAGRSRRRSRKRSRTTRRWPT